MALRTGRKVTSVGWTSRSVLEKPSLGTDLEVHPTSKPRARPGAILAMVLVSLFVASLIGLSVVEVVLLQHRQRAAVAQRQQCFWLAESGVERGIQRLAKSPEYAGETWLVPGEVLGTSCAGVVTIRVTKAAQPAGRKILVEARFPDDPVRRTVVQREHFINLSRPGGSS